MNSTGKPALVENFNDAATALERAASELRAEAAWIERNHPLTEWSDETAESYLASSRASREHEVRVATADALDLLDAPNGLTRTIRRGGQ